jgi:ribosome-associated protein
MPKSHSKKSRVSRARPDASAAAAGQPAAKKRRGVATKRSKPKKARPTLAQVVAAALDDLKAIDATFLDVHHLTTVTDTMAVASGRSDRHVRAIASAVVEQCKQAGYRPLGVEGEKSGEWVLVDLGDVVVHVMLPRVREFYNLEKLWGMTARDEAAEAGA